MPVYETLSGHTVEYDDGPPELDKIIKKLHAMLADPKATSNDMIAVAYAPDNPILGPSLRPDRGGITKETLLHPAYRVIGDLLFRKDIAAHDVDVAKLAATYTLSVVEAAARIGVHESAIRQAIKAGRLPAWLKNGQNFLSPQKLDAYEVTSKGPAPAHRIRPEPLSVSVGSVENLSFHVKGPSKVQVTSHPEKHLSHGTLKKWRRVGVISGDAGKYRLFILEPATEDNALNHGPFFVRGRFAITRKVNNAKEARAEWKDFEPE